MKTFASILAAAVLSGLGGFFLFNWLKVFALMSNTVVVDVTVFVGFIAALTTASATLCVLFRFAIAHQDQRLVARLETRLVALEQGQTIPRPTPSTPSPAAQPEKPD